MKAENNDLDSNIDFKIWKEFSSVYKVLYKNLEAFLNEYGIGIIEFRILKTLSTEGVCPMVKLAELNLITQPWITGIIDKLEKKGLVERKRSSSDRRIINIELKSKGAVLYDELKEKYEENISKIFAPIDLETKEQFLEVLNIIENAFKST